MRESKGLVQYYYEDDGKDNRSTNEILLNYMCGNPLTEIPLDSNDNAAQEFNHN